MKRRRHCPGVFPSTLVIVFGLSIYKGQVWVRSGPHIHPGLDGARCLVLLVIGMSQTCEWSAVG